MPGRTDEDRGNPWFSMLRNCLIVSDLERLCCAEELKECQQKQNKIEEAILAKEVSEPDMAM
jgi:hypothetical protein